MRERRKHYIGTVEIWANGSKKLETSARLVGYVKVSVIRPLGVPDEPFDGPSSWDGHIDIAEADAQTLVAELLELRFPDGRVGKGQLDGTGGRLQGFDVPPFD